MLFEYGFLSSPLIGWQVIEELETYDSHANHSFGHTWYYGESWYQKIYYPAPSYGIDANTTFEVRPLRVLQYYQ